MSMMRLDEVSRQYFSDYILKPYQKPKRQNIPRIWLQEEKYTSSKILLWDGEEQNIICWDKIKPNTNRHIWCPMPETHINMSLMMGFTPPGKCQLIKASDLFKSDEEIRKDHEKQLKYEEHQAKLDEKNYQDYTRFLT